MIDRATRWPEAVPIFDICDQTVADALIVKYFNKIYSRKNCTLGKSHTKIMNIKQGVGIMLSESVKETIVSCNAPRAIIFGGHLCRGLTQGLEEGRQIPKIKS